MTSGRPVLLVGASGSGPLASALGAVLAEHGFVIREVAPELAHHEVTASAVDAAVCTKVPGWRLLVSRLAAAGTATVVVAGDGAIPTALPRGVHAVRSAAEVPDALDAALATRGPQAAVAAGPTLEQRLAAAERWAEDVRTLHLARTPEEIAWEAVRRGRLRVRADRVLCWRVTHDGRLSLGAADPPLPSVDGALAIGEGLAGACAAESLTVLHPEGDAPPELVATATARDGLDAGAMLAVPLVRGGELVGVLEAVRRQGMHAFTDAERKDLEAWAAQVSTALSGALNVARLHEVQAELLAANAALEAKVDLRTRAVVHAKREWERTFDAIAEPIALQDGFVVRRANLAYAEAAGVPITQVPGRTCFQLLAGRVAPCEGCPLPKGAGAELTAELALRHGRVVRLSGFRTEPSEAPERVVVHYRDVTAERSARARLRDEERLHSMAQLARGVASDVEAPLAVLHAELRAMREALRELDSTADSVERAARLAGRNDVTGAVRALTEVPLRQVAGELAGALDEALASSERLGALARGLRELARPEHGRPEPLDVVALVRRAVRTELGEAGAVDVRGEVSARVQAVASDLERALVQLLRNARRARPDATPTVRVSDEDGEVVLEVRDDGPGLPPEMLARVIEPFAPLPWDVEGAGLERAAAWATVQRAGGRIEVRSSLGVGTTVVVRLPALAAEHVSPLARTA